VCCLRSSSDRSVRSGRIVLLCDPFSCTALLWYASSRLQGLKTEQMCQVLAPTNWERPRMGDPNSEFSFVVVPNSWGLPGLSTVWRDASLMCSCQELHAAHVAEVAKLRTYWAGLQAQRGQRASSWRRFVRILANSATRHAKCVRVEARLTAAAGRLGS